MNKVSTRIQNKDKDDKVKMNLLFFVLKLLTTEEFNRVSKSWSPKII